MAPQNFQIHIMWVPLYGKQALSTSVCGPISPSLQNSVAAIIYHESQIPAPGGLLCLYCHPQLPATTTPPLPHLVYVGDMSCPLCSSTWYISPPYLYTKLYFHLQVPTLGMAFGVRNCLFSSFPRNTQVKRLKHWINTLLKERYFEFRRWGKQTSNCFSFEAWK